MKKNYYNNEFIELVQERYGIIGRSTQIKSAIELLVQAAPTDLSVLITGETGTGKEVFAAAIHGLSERKNKPYVSVNCGAIPESLLESELFGHEKGAFTGASDLRIGFFESANNGTIFLDEIGEMPIGTQVKLLRILESGEFSRLGSSTNRKVNVRVIAATNRELLNSVKINTFREDLYFRLKNVHIELPSLRERLEDIEPLINFFAGNTAKQNGFKFVGISVEALNILKSLPWRGNVRELKNMVDTVVTLEKAEYITPDILNAYIPKALPSYQFHEQDSASSLVTIPKEEDSNFEMGLIFRSLLEIKHELTDLKYGMKKIITDIEELKEAKYDETFEEKANSIEDIYENLNEKRLDQLEKKMIEITLKHTDGNRRLAAQQLGISERTLYRKINDYNLV